MKYLYECFGKTYSVEIARGWYSTGVTALKLVSDDGEPVAKVTVNIPEIELGEGEILVKTWSENEPMAQFLIDHHIATDTGKRVELGYAEAWVMKLTDQQTS